LAFIAGTTHQIRVYSKDLPPLPRTIKEVATHPQGKEFYQAAIAK